MPGSKQNFATVAPLVGAWIETENTIRRYNAVLSHPSWVRGLKPFVGGDLSLIAVAPLVGAWIETTYCHVQQILSWSHPSWVRGLKLNSASPEPTERLSHPSWVRGLKQENANNIHRHESRTPRGCVD